MAVSVSKANNVLGVLKPTVCSKNREIVSALYRSLVRPLLEYASPVWSHYLVKDKLAIESIKRTGCIDALCYIHTYGTPPPKAYPWFKIHEVTPEDLLPSVHPSIRLVTAERNGTTSWSDIYFTVCCRDYNKTQQMHWRDSIAGLQLQNLKHWL